MNKEYYDAVTKMEEAGVDADYICGWEGGYVLNPPREEQRVTDAYEAGYDDGKEKNSDNFSNGLNKPLTAYRSTKKAGVEKHRLFYVSCLSKKT